MPTIRKIAKVAGVSNATVSRVLRQQPGVRPETRQKVLAARARLLDQIALAETLLAVVITDLLDPYFAEVAVGIMREAQVQGLGVVMGNMERSVEKARCFLQTMAERKISQVIFAGGGAIDNAFRQLWSEYASTANVVMIGRHSLDLPTIAVDEVAGAKSGVKHLIELGHRRIAMLCGPSTSVAALDRLEGYMSALFCHHLPYASELILEGDFSAQSGYEAGERLLAIRPLPTAVFCSNDLMALGLMRRLLQAGVRIPRDISVMGYGRLHTLRYSSIELTSIVVPATDLGVHAVRLLVEQDGDRVEQEILLPTELYHGESTGPARSV